MKKQMCFFWFLLSLLPLRAQMADSIDIVCNLAAAGRVEAVRPFWEQHRDRMPVGQRLFLDWHIAKADGDRERMKMAGDSLVADTTGMFDGWRFIFALDNAKYLSEQGQADRCRIYMDRIWQTYLPQTMGYGEMEFDKFRTLFNRSLHGTEETRAFWKAYAEGELWNRLLDAGLNTDGMDLFARDWLRLMKDWRMGRAEQALETARYVEKVHADSLTLFERLDIAVIRCQMLERLGRYAELERCADSVMRDARVGSTVYINRELDVYRQIGRYLAGTPRPVVERPARDCSVPLLHEGWPLQVSCTLNGHEVKVVTIDTGASSSLIDSLDAARCGVRLLPVTTYVSSYLGIHKCRFGMVDSLRVGDVVFRNRLVRVIDDDSWTHPGNVRTLLGMSELIALGVVDLHKDRVVFPYQPVVGNKSPNFYFPSYSGIRFRGKHRGVPYTFCLDTGSGGIYLGKADFSPEDSGRDFDLTTDFASLNLGDVTFQENGNADHAGLIGMPFVSRFDRFRIDFRSMRIEGEGVSPLRWHIPSLINNGDFFRLERLQKEWDRSEELYVLMGELFVRCGKNSPDSLLSVLDRLEKKYAAGFDPNFKAALVAFRENALLDAGRYENAAQVLETYLATCPDPLKAEVRRKLAFLESLRGVPAMRMERTERDKVIRISRDKAKALCLDARLNGRKIMIGMDWAQNYLRLPVEMAGKLHVKILQKDYVQGNDTVSVGVADELRLGNVTLSHVVCFIGKSIERPSIGVNVLRNLPPFILSGKSLAYVDSPDTEVALRLVNNYLLAEVGDGREYVSGCLVSGDRIETDEVLKSKDLFVGKVKLPKECFGDGSYQVSPYHGARISIGIEALLGQGNRLAFDFKNMRMKIMQGEK